MTTPASRVTAEKSEVTRPCPFCGTHPKLRITMEQYPAEGNSPAGEYDAWYTFACDECGIEIGAEYRSEALENWNKRKAPEKHFTSYADVPEPLPMEAEIWAAGADPETAHFVARLLGYQGYELIQNEPAVSEEVRGFLYALLGADTWLEAGAIWEQNPDQRKAAHAFFSAALNGDKP